MTQLDPLARFHTDLAKRPAARDRLPDQHPLSISPWMAMSLLQKAVCRGRNDLALRAAATLLRDASDRLWRRLGGIALEDVGLGCLPVVGLTCAALHSKRLRADLGGDWAVASLVVQAICDAPKSRASDDLLMALETLWSKTTRIDLRVATALIGIAPSQTVDPWIRQCYAFGE